MQKKWKQTSVALLIAGLAVAGTSYALADEKEAEVIELTQPEKESTTNLVKDSTETVKLPVEGIVDEELKIEKIVEDKATEPTVATEEKAVVENVLPETPEGYTAGNLEALGKAYEKVQNPTAKAAIKRNMDRSVEKWENKQLETKTSEQPKLEAPQQPETKVPEQAKIKEEKETVKQEATLKQDQPAKVEKEKAPQAQLNEEHKKQRQELKANQKAEREAIKAERKTDKEK